MFDFTTSAPSAAQDSPRESLFTVDGVAYSIPVKVDAATAIRFANVVRTRGYDIAAAWAAEELLTEDGFVALLSVQGADDTAYLQCLSAIADRASGGTTGTPDPAPASDLTSQAQDIVDSGAADAPAPKSRKRAGSAGKA